jgi:hypothetical protein
MTPEKVDFSDLIEDMISDKALGKLLGVPTATVKEMFYEGIFEGIDCLGRVRITNASVRKFLLHQNSHKPTAKPPAKRPAKKRQRRQSATVAAES